MPRCNNCGEFVTPDFARVFGDNRDELAGCLYCATESELRTERAGVADPEGIPIGE